MFSTSNVRMEFPKATLKVVKDQKNEKQRVAECALVLEPFPRNLAEELGREIAEHLFVGDADQIRPELESVSLHPRVPKQCIEVREAVDSIEPMVELRYVEILGMTVKHEIDVREGQEWLKATFKIRFDFADKNHRAFLARAFGTSPYWSFAAEQEDLELGPVAAANAFLKGVRKMMSDGESHLTSVAIGHPDGTGVVITKDEVRPIEAQA